jgi:hypothetical protein
MKTPRAIGPGTAQSRMFDPLAYVNRVSNAGLSWSPLGAAGSAVLVGAITPVMVFSATAAFVAFGNDSVAAPTSAANGLPVPANTPVFYNSGPNTHVIGSASSVFIYSADLEVSQQANPPSLLEDKQQSQESIPVNERLT